MNDQLEFLHLIVSRLNEADIQYMLTGSVAMSLAGLEYAAGRYYIHSII